MIKQQIASLMKITLGIDLVQLSRISSMVSRHKEHFLHRVYTEREIEYAGSGKKSIERLAGRFAAKEAVFKLLGTGLRGKMKWTEIEITNNELGKPVVFVSGNVEAAAAEKGISQIEISITHTADFAMASAVALAN